MLQRLGTSLYNGVSTAFPVLGLKDDQGTASLLVDTSAEVHTLAVELRNKNRLLQHCYHIYQPGILCLLDLASLWLLTNKRSTWCHLLFYFTSYVLNMFQTLIYPSSGACDCEPNLQHTMNWEQNNQCRNSTAQLQAPDDEYINVWNMLSTEEVK